MGIFIQSVGEFQNIMCFTNLMFLITNSNLIKHHTWVSGSDRFGIKGPGS